MNFKLNFSKPIIGLALLALFPFQLTFAQDDDLLSLLGDDETTDFSTATFKTTRIINGHSIENNAHGVLDFKISHRFNYLNGGAYEMFGLDGATIRLGLEYGVTDRLMVGFGRSSFEKTLDGFLKYKILRQSTGKKKMPVSLSYFSSVACKTVKWDNPERNNYFTSRLYYTHQLLVGRKFNESLSIQLSPTLVHKNLVALTSDQHDILACGIGGRYKITKRTSINVEYFYLLPDQLSDDITNSLSLGFDIETGGHVFQLHFTNSKSMIEKGFVAETTGEWSKGDIQFGFNVSRVFTVHNPKRKDV